MQNLRETFRRWHLRTLIISLIVLAIAPICFILYVYIAKTAQLDHKDLCNITISHSGTIVLEISTIVIALTLLIQQAQLKILSETHQQNYNKQILDEIRYFFMSPEMEAVRSRCWNVGSSLQKNVQNSTLLKDLKALFSKQFLNEWGSSEEYSILQQQDIFKDYAAITKLLRWFDMISFYEFDEQTSLAVSYYYFWWKEPLSIIINLASSVIHDIPANRDIPIIAPTYLSSIQRLDAKLAKYINKT